jgi:hypothetical protein
MGFDFTVQTVINFEKFKTISAQLCVIFLCLFASFLNYCIIQIFHPYIMPLTMIPVVGYALFSNNAPSIVIAVISGVMDDTMLNTQVGICPMVYIILMHALCLEKQSVITKRIIFLIFLIVFVIINIMYYSHLSALYRQCRADHPW